MGLEHLTGPKSKKDSAEKLGCERGAGPCQKDTGANLKEHPVIKAQTN